MLRKYWIFCKEIDSIRDAYLVLRSHELLTEKTFLKNINEIREFILKTNHSRTQAMNVKKEYGRKSNEKIKN